MRSVLDNGYPGEFLVLLVADGVEAAELRAQVPDNVSVRQSDRTPGTSGARNSGVLAARSDLVAYLDDDDEWLPGKLAEQVRLLRAHPEAILVSCGIKVVQPDREFERRAPRTVRHRDLIQSRIMALHSSTMLFRREVLVQGVGLLDEELAGSFAEDYDILLRVARQVDIPSVPEPHVLVHWHGASYFFSQWVTIAAALTQLLAKHPEFKRSRRGRARVEAQIAYALAASGRRREALRLAAAVFLRCPVELRLYLALAVAAQPRTAEWYQGLAHRLGRGL